MFFDLTRDMTSLRFSGVKTSVPSPLREPVSRASSFIFPAALTGDLNFVPVHTARTCTILNSHTPNETERSQTREKMVQSCFGGVGIATGDGDVVRDSRHRYGFKPSLEALVLRNVMQYDRNFPAPTPAQKNSYL